MTLDDITVTDQFNFKQHMERELVPVRVSAAYLNIRNLPSSKVEVTPTAVVVSYVGQPPDYLPSLEKALENTGKLKIEAARQRVLSKEKEYLNL